MAAETGNSQDSQDIEGRSSKPTWRRLSKPRLLALVIALAVIAAVLIYNSRATAPSGGGSAGGIKTPNLTLSPDSQKVALSEPLAVQIWADTDGQKVNAVQANLSYPIDKLNFVNVDSNGSAFGLTVEGSGGNGKITIARGSFEPVSGKLLVATVNFTGADNKGEATVNFSSTTALTSSTSNKNILADTYGGKYSLTQ
jgi:hypothetical protein